MRRLLSFKDSTNTHSSSAKGKERRRDSLSVSPTDQSSLRIPMEVRVSTEVHSIPDHQGLRPISSTTTLSSPPSPPSDSRPLPPEIHVPTHPYSYWQGYAHTPSSSSQSSLESPMTPSHVSWLSLGNTPGNPYPPSNSSNTNLNLTDPIPTSAPSAGPSTSSHSLIQGRSSPSPHFPPPPQANPPPNVNARSKLLHPTKSSHSLRVPVQESFNQQLSPIVEQDYLSPEKRTVSLPSSGPGGGSRSSTAHTVRTSTVMLTPVSPSSDIRTATVTPVTPVPITHVLVGTRGTPPTPQTQVQTPATPSYPSGSVPFARRKEEEGNDSPRPSPSPVSTFILRPLNRSISISSTRTHQSSVSSVTPPVIPPLDLKPEFKGPTFLTTPTTLHSRTYLDVGTRDDDSVSDRRESFVTARTGAGRESRYSLGQEEVFVDAEEGYRRNSDGTIQQFDSHLLEDAVNTPSTPHEQPTPQNTSKLVKPPPPPRMALHPRTLSGTSSYPPSYNNPPGAHSSDNHVWLNPQPHPHHPASHPPRLGVSAPSLQDLGTSVSTSSSFIDRRFAPSSLYLTPPSERESARHAVEKWTVHLERVDSIQVLFWLGFVAPWCWLIGGWLVSAKPLPRRSTSDAGTGAAGGSHLPLWTNAHKSMHSFDTMKMQHGYPFVAPSASSLTPPPPPYQGRTAVVLTPKPVGRGAKNPWVRRCRMAAVTSGMLLLFAFLVALVVAGVGHV